MINYLKELYVSIVFFIVSNTMDTFNRYVNTESSLRGRMYIACIKFRYFLDNVIYLISLGFILSFINNYKVDYKPEITFKFNPIINYKQRLTSLLLTTAVTIEDLIFFISISYINTRILSAKILRIFNV